MLKPSFINSLICLNSLANKNRKLSFKYSSFSTINIKPRMSRHKVGLETEDKKGNRRKIQIHQEETVVKDAIVIPTENAKSEKESAQTKTKKSKWEPTNWQIVLENIKKMRSDNDAPVDSMGCERTMEDNVDPKTKRYQTLVSLMLSSQTKDQITYAAMQRLQQEIGLTIQTILRTEESLIVQTIKPVSFFNRKAKYIKDATQILHDKYEDDIPDTVEGLCSLPGVGPKMAHICMNVAWNQNSGIGVDTHVHRISNRLGWSGPKETKTPEKTREGLESWLDPSMWQEINILLVGFGQTICTAINPKCSDCLNKTVCPFGRSELRKNGKKGKGSKSKTKADNVDSDSDGVSEYF